MQTILASSIKEVWIDCAKGLNIAVGESAVLEVESVLPVEVDRQRVAERPRQTAPVSAAKEMARATKTSDNPSRPYKAGGAPSESLRKMAEWASGHFDPQVFQAFVKNMGIYPVGSLVQLTSGRIGVVVEQASKSLTTPSVKVFFSTKSNLRILPQVIDLSRPENKEKIISPEDPEKWFFPDLNELWSGLQQTPW